MCFVVMFDVTNLKALNISRCMGSWWKVEAVVLPKVMTKLYLIPIEVEPEWNKHLTGLDLANPEFRVPGYTDVLLVVDVFSRVVFQYRKRS